MMCTYACVYVCNRNTRTDVLGKKEKRMKSHNVASDHEIVTTPKSQSLYFNNIYLFKIYIHRVYYFTTVYICI